MKTTFEKSIFLIGISLGLVMAIILISFINHKIHLSKEEHLLVPLGPMVRVNNHNMHIYTEGDGDDTLIFMSGGVISSPVLDFKNLYTLLSDTYRITVIEKSGYGFSEVSNTSRDIGSLVGENREALSQAGLKAPYILLAHSMSGIEALDRAQE